MRFHGVSLAVAFLGVPIAAVAQPFHGLFIGAGAGYKMTQIVRTTPQTSAFGTNNLRLNEDGGFVGVGSVGYGFGNGLRLCLRG